MPESLGPRMTPTGYAKQRGTPVKLLGSLEAVIRALPEGAHLIVADYRAGLVATDVILSQPRRKYLNYVYANNGPAGLFEIPEDAVVGVSPDAFRGVWSSVWADMQKILTTRFREVHWG